MRNEITLVGGGRVGWVNATFPFVLFRATEQELSISGLVGKYTFSPDEVIAIEPYGSIPIMSSGIQIVHSNANYPEKIIFWALQNPQKLIERIEELGFRPSATVLPVRDGIPFRLSFVVSAVIVWNVLCLVGFNQYRDRPQLGMLLPVGTLFLLPVLGATSAQFRSIMLKPGRNIGEVKPFLTLLFLISGFMLFISVTQLIFK